MVTYILEMQKWRTDSWLSGVKDGVGLVPRVKGNIKDLCDGTVLYFDHQCQSPGCDIVFLK